MRKELNVKDIKWMLDFKVLEEISKNGKAQVSVYNLKKMTNKTIEDANDTIQGIENGTYTGISEEALNNLKDGATSLKEKAIEVLKELNTYSNSAVIEFTGGCQ